jgi:hypothetical protein
MQFSRALYKKSRRTFRCPFKEYLSDVHCKENPKVAMEDMEDAKYQPPNKYERHQVAREDMEDAKY